MLADKLRILIIEARRHPDLADAMLNSARNALHAAGAECDVVTAPDVFSIPGTLALAEQGGHRPAGVRYDGYVALGCLIRGETLRFDVLSQETVRALMDLTIGRHLLIGDGLVTVDTEAQAWDRVNGARGDRGGDAARNCLAMIALKRRLLGHTR